MKTSTFSSPPVTGGSGGIGNVVGPSSAVNNNIAVFSGTTGKIIADGGATVASLLPSASVLRSYLATTVTYNADASLGDTPLSVTVAAGGIYAIELVVHSTSDVVGLLLDFAGTATIANFVGHWSIEAAALDINFSNVTAAGTDFNGGTGDGVSSAITFTGSVEITDAGTFLLRGAQNVSDPAPTTILQGSTLILTRMN